MKSLFCFLALVTAAIAIPGTASTAQGASMATPGNLPATHPEDCYLSLGFWNMTDDWALCEVYVQGIKIGTELVRPHGVYYTYIPCDPVWEYFLPEYHYYDLRGNFLYKIGTFEPGG
ncbi:MAG: hypothetical protein AAF456_18200 [Planctomycetota bacterium]